MLGILDRATKQLGDVLLKLSQLRLIGLFIGLNLIFYGRARVDRAGRSVEPND